MTASAATSARAEASTSRPIQHDRQPAARRPLLRYHRHVVLEGCAIWSTVASGEFGAPKSQNATA